jgi:hypothetical protein
VSARQYPDGCVAHAAGLPPRRAAPPCGVPGVQQLVHEGCAMPLQQWPAASAADRHQRQHNKMSPPAPALGTTTRQQPTDLAMLVTEHTQQPQRPGSPIQRAAARLHAASHCSHVAEACPSSRVHQGGFRIQGCKAGLVCVQSAPVLKHKPSGVTGVSSRVLGLQIGSGGPACGSFGQRCQCGSGAGSQSSPAWAAAARPSFPRLFGGMRRHSAAVTGAGCSP